MRNQYRINYRNGYTSDTYYDRQLVVQVFLSVEDRNPKAIVEKLHHDGEWRQMIVLERDR